MLHAFEGGMPEKLARGARKASSDAKCDVTNQGSANCIS